MFRQTDLISIFGKRGSGKSTLCKKIQGAFPRLVVFDLLREYRPKDFDYAVETLPDLGRALDEIAESGISDFTLLYQFDDESTRDQREEFEIAAEAIYRFGNCMAVIEEFHHFMPNSGITPWVKKLILYGRHRKIGIMGTSQRPAECSKTFVSQCHHVFVARMFEKNDLAYFADTLGNNAERLPTIADFNFLWVHDGIKPGNPARIIKNK